MSDLCLVNLIQVHNDFLNVNTNNLQLPFQMTLSTWSVMSSSNNETEPCVFVE